MNDFEKNTAFVMWCIEELHTWKFINQICFHTEKALQYLHFVKGELV